MVDSGFMIDEGSVSPINHTVFELQPLANNIGGLLEEHHRANLFHHGSQQATSQRQTLTPCTFAYVAVESWLQVHLEDVKRVGRSVLSSPRCAEQSLESGSSDGMLEDESAGDEDSGESDDDEWDPSLATPAVAGRRRTRSGSGRRSRHSVSANTEILFLNLFPCTESP